MFCGFDLSLCFFLSLSIYQEHVIVQMHVSHRDHVEVGRQPCVTVLADRLMSLSFFWLCTPGQGRARPSGDLPVLASHLTATLLRQMQ